MGKSFLILQKVWQLIFLRQLQRGVYKKWQRQQVIWFEIRQQKRLQRLLQKLLVRIQKYLCKYHNQQVYQRKYTEKRQSGSEWLASFDYYNFRYIARVDQWKITNLFDKTNDQPQKFRIRNWVEVNDYTNNGEYNPSSQIKFNTLIFSGTIVMQSISQHQTMKTRLCLFCQVQTVVFLFAHLLL